MPYCQWCAKERDPDSIAVHHCGSQDRPPAFCMNCAAPLGEGATSCGACGTPAGQLPAAQPVAASPAQGDDAGTAMVSGAAGAGTVEATTYAARPMPVAARTSATGGVDLYARTLRHTLLWAAIFATFSFFISWAGSTTGIQAVEQFPTKWWGPPSPNILFTLVLVILLATILLNTIDRGRAVAMGIVLLSVALAVCVADWLWFFKSSFIQLTGFWVLVGASVVLVGASVAYVGHGGDAE